MPDGGRYQVPGRRTFSANCAQQAWLLIAVAAVLLVAVTFEPVRVGFYLWHEEWLETQPGGRGYQGPT